MGRQIARSIRRSALKRGALGLAGLLGLGLGGKHGPPSVAAAAAPPGGPMTFTLHGRDWHVFSHDRPAGYAPATGDRLTLIGELLEAPDGAKVGEFYSACLALNAPFGPGPVAASSLEMHTFSLDDGTIVGMGAPTPDANAFAVIGGTGRYAGASGSYVARQEPTELGGDGTAEFTFTISL